jgi:glycosyltransferase involved in cell wall biosynthesis
MKMILWLSLIGILYTYVGYPVIIWMLARLRPQPWHAAPGMPSVSVVMAVRNGIALLPGKIQHLLNLDYPNIKEIIIVSDGSTDGTAELLASDRNSRIKAIVLEEHRGKAVAVNAGVAAATGDILLFVDIRPEIAPGAIQLLMNNFADPKVGCVSGILNLRQDGHDGPSAAVGGFYWRYEQWLRTCEATIDSPVGVYGGFYAIRRELAAQQPDGMILDDMFQPLSIIRQGYRSVIDPEAYVYDMWPKAAGSEFQRKVRTLAGNFQLLQLAPWTLSTQNRVLFQLVSHKIMRLIVPYFLIFLLVFTISLSTTSAAYRTFAVIQLLGWAVAILGLKFKLPGIHRVAAPASALLVLNAAAVVGFYKFLFTRGPLWKIWGATNPAIRHSDAQIGMYAQMDIAGTKQMVAVNESISLDSRSEKRHEMLRASANLGIVVLLGAGATITGLVYHNHVVRVKAAKVEHVVAPAPYFPPAAVWTQDVSHAPLDARSYNTITWLASVGGWGFGRMQVDFGIRVLQASANTPRVPFRKDHEWISPDSDNVSEIPLPSGGGMEGQNSYQCPSDREDCHLIVLDRDHGKLYEAWQANETDNVVRANFVAVWDLNRVYPPSGRGDQCTSADAAGFPIAPLLFSADELASGSINHALRFILPNPRIRARVFQHPATHAGAPSGPPNAPPYGAHLRLKASFDVSKLKPTAQIVARAMQKYGIFLADGGNIALTAQSDKDTTAKYSDVDFASRDLESIKVTDFEVLDDGPLIPMTDECVRNK